MTTSSITIAATGDLHCDGRNVAEVKTLLEDAADRADVILLAGDLTTRGEPSEAEALADVARGIDTPLVAVLGNHDWHVGRGDEVATTLEDAGIVVLERAHATIPIGDTTLGIAGTKGFVGGFSGSHLPDFGEPLLREVYRETTADVLAIDEALHEIALCPFRVVLLHYSPSEETLAGEPPGIWMMLGSDRLAAPVREHEPTAVFHGHAHAGTREGLIGDVPVFNVSLPLSEGRMFIHELRPPARGAQPIH